MALYNKFFGDYDMQNMEDDYHGEYDDEAYGSLYIPHIEEQLASMAEIKRVFAAKKIGDVTTVTFSELIAPKTYKGKNKKQAYSAIVYLKWRETLAATALRQAIQDGDKHKSRIALDAKHHWIVHSNTAMLSDELYEERCYNADTEDTVMGVISRLLDYSDDEDTEMYNLEELAKDVAMRVFL